MEKEVELRNIKTCECFNRVIEKPKADCETTLVVLDKHVFFFFEQKTAYKIQECDWSSDVCSSDLFPRQQSPDYAS